MPEGTEPCQKGQSRDSNGAGPTIEANKPNDPPPAEPRPPGRRSGQQNQRAHQSIAAPKNLKDRSAPSRRHPTPSARSTDPKTQNRARKGALTNPTKTNAPRTTPTNPTTHLPQSPDRRRAATTHFGGRPRRFREPSASRSNAKLACSIRARSSYSACKIF